jgi:GTP-binding protein LepA
MERKMNQTNIRNFSVIAHIDHGKSTLADRIMEIGGIIKADSSKKEQILDDMELEKERGITIKLKAVRLGYKKNNEEYELNLIDTPGHVDFGYEVSRSLAACEGALLLVDATQGVEAQTIVNLDKARSENLTIIPVVNKIDLASAQLESTALQLIDLGFEEKDICFTSGKTGQGVKELLDKIVETIPAPSTNNYVLKDAENIEKSRALVFDSFYDDYRGVVAFVRVLNGKFTSQDFSRLLATKAESKIVELGYLSPTEKLAKELTAGEVGFIATGHKSISDVRVGDTMTLVGQDPTPVPGYKEPVPVVFLSFYPVDASDYLELRDAVERLKLNDAAFVFEPESIGSIGKGFRCGFLGLLHADIVQERIEREFNVSVMTTTPSVRYLVKSTSGEVLDIKSPAEFPDPTKIDEVQEPWAEVAIYTKSQYMSMIMDLCKERRSEYLSTDILEGGSMRITYNIPLIELIIDFFDKLKSISSGYASIDYKLIGYRPTDAVKMDVLVAGDLIAPLAQLVQRTNAYEEGIRLVSKLKELIPKQQFQVSLQAAINGKVVAREDISAVRKDMIGHLYGGDVTRKNKLLDKQKKGKSRMKKFGKVEIPQGVFWKVMER